MIESCFTCGYNVGRQHDMQFISFHRIPQSCGVILVTMYISGNFRFIKEPTFTWRSLLVKQVGIAIYQQVACFFYIQCFASYIVIVSTNCSFMWWAALQRCPVYNIHFLQCFMSLLVCTLWLMFGHISVHRTYSIYNTVCYNVLFQQYFMHFLVGMNFMIIVLSHT